MPREKNTKTHNIYLLDKSRMQRVLEIQGETSVQALVAQVMSSDENYCLQTLKGGIDTAEFSVELYFREDARFQSKFSSFCKSFVADDQKAVTFYPRSSSSVLFIWNSDKLFAITTGQGFRMIENYAVPKFGLIIASAFEQRFKITSLDSNAMSSIVHSTKTVYSNEVDFIDIETLDTIFKEVTGRLKDTAKVHTLLNLIMDSKKNSMKIIAKDYVQFSSSLNFNGLIHLLTIISAYDFENLSDRFNLITPIGLKKNRDIVHANDNEVIHSMYEALISGRSLPFDLFHKDTGLYISADSYVVYDQNDMREYTSQNDFEATQLLSDAFSTYLNGSPSTETAFYAFATSAKLRAQKEDDSVTDGTLMQHVSGEVCVDGINYYVFYGQYYRLNTAYNDRLKASLRGKLRPEFITSEIRTQWTRGCDEDWFNKSTSINEDYIHLHKIKPDYIEFCDLLKCDGDTVTIVHVKDGFDGDMRVLDRQVELSIAKIMDLKHNNNDTYMKKLYQNAKENTVGKNISTAFPSENEFLDCMKNKQIRYIIAVRPENPDLLENRSNIAKHCLNALILRCFNQGISLNIQIL